MTGLGIGFGVLEIFEDENLSSIFENNEIVYITKTLLRIGVTWTVSC